ncbi:hypothetical protein BT93_E1475 [Corymbia citriodora subsp. variegata]|nr:hypothetical protein BT93_E1475 [Corymbia citriodora subsp. variegata]
MSAILMPFVVVLGGGFPISAILGGILGLCFLEANLWYDTVARMEGGESPYRSGTEELNSLTCEPDIPEHHYDFSRYAFWVHIEGIPSGWVLEEVYVDVVEKVGSVLDIQLEPKGNGPYRASKVKVELELTAPLKTGTIADLGEKKLWVEFKYERLPHFYYSCGRIGHYASYCEEIPYEKTSWSENKAGKYGPWLKAKVHDHSPHWEAFYGKLAQSLEEGECVPETPNPTSNMDILVRAEVEVNVALVRN